MLLLLPLADVAAAVADFAMIYCTAAVVAVAVAVAIAVAVAVAIVVFCCNH